MPRTAPAPNIPPIPGMCPSIAVLAGGGDGGGGSGKGAGDGSGDNNAGAGSGGENAEGDGRGAPDPAKYPQCGYASHPVDVVTGRAFTHPITDLSLPGPLPLVLERVYSSKMAGRDVGLGFGWGHSFGWEVEVGRRSIIVWNEQGVAVDFPMIHAGSDAIGPWGWVLRRESWGFAVDAGDGLWHVFSAPEADGKRYRLTAIEDRNKNRIALTYEDGRLVEAKDSAGRLLRFASTREGRIASIQVQGAVPNGAWVTFATYTYDGAGNLITAGDADGFSSRYEYDEDHRLTSDTDRAGLTFHFVYDREGRCVEAWGDYPGRRDPSLVDAVPRYLHDGVTRVKGIHHCKFEYHQDGYSEVVDSTQTRRFFGTKHGTLAKSVDGGAVMTVTYRDDGHMLSRTDGVGATTQFERDARGRLTKVVDPLGRTTTFERDAAGLTVDLVDPAGGIWKHERDARGNLLVLTDPLGSVTSRRYDERGLRTDEVSPTGARSAYTYDAHGNLVSAKGPTGGEFRLTYDDFGRALSLTDPFGAEKRFAYSTRGDLVSARDSLGGVTRYTYDGERRLTQIVNPKGSATSLTWGGYNKLCTRRDANGNEVRLGYNLEGELVELRNERGEIHRLAYTASGALVGETTFDGRELRYRRDAAGRIVRYTNGLRQITQFEYDLAGQLIARSFADDAVEEFTYDQRGALASAKGPAGEILFEHDALGRVVREVQIVGGEEHTVSITYDAAGARVGRETSLGHTEVVTRGPLGERTQTVLDGEHAIHHRVDLLGREIARALPAGGWIQSTYDARGRLGRRRAGGVEGRRATAASEPAFLGERADGGAIDTTYQYDWDDELVHAADRARGITQYEYDPVGQLLAMTPEKARKELFRYDEAGNLHESGGEGRAREYGAGSRLIRQGATEYRWDDDGQLVEKRTYDRASGRESVWSYRWDGKGLLERVDGPEGLQVEHRYDPLARRVQKRVTRPGPSGRREVVSLTQFVWDGDVPVHEIQVSPQAGRDPAVEQRTYLFEDGSLEPAAHRELRRDEPENSRWFHYVNDPIGTPDRLVAANGETACDLRHSAWGATEALPGGKASTPLRFQGQYEDGETGLCYNRWRYYDADTGMFASADPKGLEAGMHAFRYVPNPTAWIDPFGLVLRAATRMEKGGGVQLGAVLSQDQAINRMGNSKNNDVHADTQAEAEALAAAANKANGRTCTPTTHPAHTQTAGPKALPHVHPDKDNTLSNNAHIFFPKT